mgnify:CR=1 FL=1
MSILDVILLKLRLAFNYLFNSSRSITSKSLKGINQDIEKLGNTPLSKNMLRHRNLSELSDALSNIRSNVNSDAFPTKYQTYDEAWAELFINYDLLRSKLGLLHEQIIDMTKQAKVHYETGERKLGSWLMQDIGEVVRGQPPFAYPEELYRWPKVWLVT